MECEVIGSRPIGCACNYQSKEKNVFKVYFFEVGDGTRVSFQSDVWCRETPLKLKGFFH